MMIISDYTIYFLIIFFIKRFKKFVVTTFFSTRNAFLLVFCIHLTTSLAIVSHFYALFWKVYVMECAKLLT